MTNHGSATLTGPKTGYSSIIVWPFVIIAALMTPFIVGLVWLGKKAAKRTPAGGRLTQVPFTQGPVHDGPQPTD
jgi:hypothetical protein